MHEVVDLPPEACFGLSRRPVFRRCRTWRGRAMISRVWVDSEWLYVADQPMMMVESGVVV